MHPPPTITLTEGIQHLVDHIKSDIDRIFAAQYTLLELRPGTDEPISINSCFAPNGSDALAMLQIQFDNLAAKTGLDPESLAAALLAGHESLTRTER
jgi:hypothetical protein